MAARIDATPGLLGDTWSKPEIEMMRTRRVRTKPSTTISYPSLFRISLVIEKASSSTDSDFAARTVEARAQRRRLAEVAPQLDQLDPRVELVGLTYAITGGV